MYAANIYSITRYDAFPTSWLLQRWRYATQVKHLQEMQPSALHCWLA